MKAMDAILTRRSIRAYTSKPLPREAIDELLKAAMSAPSAGNEKPWHFILLTDRALIDEIPKFHPYSSMVKQAPAVVLICGDTTLEKHKGYWVQDCSAATENMLLAAHAKGFGAVWCGVYPREERIAGFRKLLNLPEHIVPFSLVPVGHPAEEKQPVDRFDRSRVHENRW